MLPFQEIKRKMPETIGVLQSIAKEDVASKQQPGSNQPQE